MGYENLSTSPIDLGQKGKRKKRKRTLDVILSDNWRKKFLLTKPENAEKAQTVQHCRQSFFY